MKHKYIIVLVTLTVILVTSCGTISAQRYSFNKWDRVVFRNNPPFGQRLYSLTEINLGYGAHYLDQPYEIRRFGISTLLGYRYNRAITLGLGTGIEAYNGGNLGTLYLEGQIYLNRFVRGSVKPYLTGSGGFLQKISGLDTDIRVFANPGIGLMIPMTYRASLMVGVGLYTQWALSVERYSFINARMGILFY